MTDSLRSSATEIARPDRFVVFCALLALVSLFAARALGPSDLWDQTQPKTISATSDIILHGSSHWLLPIERGELPATKPPLYNWLAVPWVKWFGFDSEIAHKTPSIIAFCICWLMLMRLGRRIDNEYGEMLGWLAGLMLCANYPMFKLAYLARPDMVLTLWLMIAWMCATKALIDGANRTSGIGFAALFWLCIALAGLTKGPAAVVGVGYAVVAARVVGGSWRSLGLLRPIAGVTFCLLVVGGWFYAVWLINPGHVREQLWFNEIYGRVTGLGPEGSSEGPRAWLSGLPNQLWYYLVRFLPWSLCSIAAMIVIWRRKPRIEEPLRSWLIGAMTFVLIIVGLYSLSTGKRADYLAAALPPGSLLGAWWVLHAARQRRPWLIWGVSALALLALGAMTIVNQSQPLAPVRGFGDAILEFARQANVAVEQQPAPVTFCWTGETPLQALMGASQIDNGKNSVLELMARGQPFWVVAGRKGSTPQDFGDWLAERREKCVVTPMVRSAILPRAEGWPEQMTLFRVEPVK